jgi:hypothetical protein
MSTENDLSLSQLSLNSTNSQGDDWDRSFVQQDGKGHVATSRASTSQMRTPRSSVIFPSPIEDNQRTPGKRSTQAAKRPLSEILRMHAEKGTDVKCSPEDASRLAEALGQWVRSCTSIPRFQTLTEALATSSFRSEIVSALTDKFIPISVRRRRRLFWAVTGRLISPGPHILSRQDRTAAWPE